MLRYTAFSDNPAGGNPAGVVLDAEGLTTAEMQRIAAEVGFSETAFLTVLGEDAFRVRYFSPGKEVAFCGHATVAAAVAWAEQRSPGQLRLTTNAGEVRVETSVSSVGAMSATLTSVRPVVEHVDDSRLAELLMALRWSADELDPSLPVRVASAGARHPVIAAATRDRLAMLDYDFPRLAALMNESSWDTIDLIWQESEYVFHARNPFPVGGVVEDPATGAAAAALGGYLRELDLVAVPAKLTVYQGADLGRPSVITVDIPAEPGTGIRVSGTAVRLAP